jgi:hypothetical protein
MPVASREAATTAESLNFTDVSFGSFVLARPLPAVVPILRKAVASTGIRKVYFNTLLQYLPGVFPNNRLKV